MTRNAYMPVPEKGENLSIPLDAYGSHPAVTHLVDRASALAINAALATGRPLLLRGEPGTGKSQLARAAATKLNRQFLLHAVDARTDTRDLLYTVDAVARLARAQLAGARHEDAAAAEEALDVMNFVHPGPLWMAYDPPRPSGAPDVPHPGAVLLIDEIDKADPSVPNGLLDAFGSGSFTVEGRLPVKAKPPLPLVILTTNEERALPDPFLRRCLVHILALPKLPEERDAFINTLELRGHANVQAAKPKVLRAAADMIVDARLDPRNQGLCPPGVAEYIDLLRAVTTLAEGVPAQIALLKELQELATRKHPPEHVG